MSRPDMVWVVFTEAVILPRFAMKVGDRWRKRKDRISPEGFYLGGGFIRPESYEIVE